LLDRNDLMNNAPKVVIILTGITK